MQLEPYLDTYGPRKSYSSPLPNGWRALTQQNRTDLWDFLVTRDGRSGIRRGIRDARNERLRPGACASYWSVRPVLNNPPATCSQVSERTDQSLLADFRPPSASPDPSTRRLRDIFDADLERLGRWLGVELSCDLYRETVLNQSCEWGRPEGGILIHSRRPMAELIKSEGCSPRSSDPRPPQGCLGIRFVLSLLGRSGLRSPGSRPWAAGQTWAVGVTTGPRKTAGNLSRLTGCSRSRSPSRSSSPGPDE